MNWWPLYNIRIMNGLVSPAMATFFIDLAFFKKFIGKRESSHLLSHN